MSLATQPPTSSSQHAPLLARILQICETLPASAFTPSLLNYVLFPLTSILRQSDTASLPDNFLEAAYSLLAFVVTKWRQAPGGMGKAWEQLWRFVVASASPRVGKDAREPLSQEAATAALNTLIALLASPTSEMRSLAEDKAQLLPTLFQSITFAVDLAVPQPPNTGLQRAAVHLIRIALPYVRANNVLASLLPGVVSAMAKAIVAGVKGDIGAEMAGVVCDVLVRTLDDATLREAGVLAPQYDDLAGLAGAWSAQQDKDDGVDDIDMDTDTPSTSQSQSGVDPFPPLTANYLQFTSAQLQATVPPILSSLTQHQSPDSRAAAAALAAALLTHCRASLPRLVPSCLSTLLLLSTDDFDAVRHAAEKHLSTLLAADAPELETSLVDLLSGAVNALPRLIRAGDERRVDETARLITALAHTTAKRSFNPIAAFLGPSGHVERWAFALLECLEFGRPRGWSAQEGGAARTAALGWEGGMKSRSLPLLTGPSSDTGAAADSGPEGVDDFAKGTSSGAGGKAPSGPPPDAAFPHLPLRYVPSPRIEGRLESMLSALGQAGGESALHSVSYFVRYARGNAGAAPARSASAVWVADALLSGIASSTSDPSGTASRPPKPVRKAARDLARSLIDIDEDEEEAYEQEAQSEQSTELLAPERKSGLDELTTLLDRPMANASASAETARLDRQSQRQLLLCLTLRSLSLSASILGASFRPLLLHTLYPVLAALSHPSDLVRTFAETALARIAYESGYASAENMVLANADYIINSVSQRLTYHRLDAQAPLVLIAMIRLVGAEIVPQVHDIVDEVFDALDAFHGYAALASALLAVLNALVEIMARDPGLAQSEEGKRRKEEDERDIGRFLRPPRPEEDFAKFGEWWASRSEKAQDDIEGLLERAPRHGWGKHAPGAEGGGDSDGGGGGGDGGGGEGGEGMAEEEEGEKEAEQEIPPTRPEELATAILQKSTFYLSHASPFLRARVLGLMASCVSVLSSRPSALLPEIDKAWPTIMLRLDDTEPYVVVEALGLLRTLCEDVPGFVSRRLADAWPTLRRLLVQQVDRDRRSDLAARPRARVTASGKGGGGGGGLVGAGMVDRHSVSHRVYAALVSVAQFMIASVPVKDGVVWDVAVSFRAFLDARAEEELQKAATGLYTALNERDGDLTWVVLSASIGTLEGDKGTWEYLREDGVEMKGNAMAVLAS